MSLLPEVGKYHQSDAWPGADWSRVETGDLSRNCYPPGCAGPESAGAESDCTLFSLCSGLDWAELAEGHDSQSCNTTVTTVTRPLSLPSIPVRPRHTQLQLDWTGLDWTGLLSRNYVQPDIGLTEGLRNCGTNTIYPGDQTSLQLSLSPDWRLDSGEWRVYLVSE